jgi:hypothetical protein
MADSLRKLPVDLADLISAMDMTTRDTIDFFLDTTTGEVICLSRDLEEDEDRLDEVDSDDTGRFVRIDEFESAQSYGLMEDFVRTVTSEHLQRELQRAISRKGAFRRFMDTLLGVPRERERWFEFQQSQQRQMASQWLEEIGIQSTWQPPARPS